VKGRVTDAGVAGEVAAQALNDRDHSMVQLVLSLNSHLGSSATGVATFVASQVASGRLDEAVGVAGQVTSNREEAVQVAEELRRIASGLPPNFLDTNALSMVLEALADT
jgi:signal transduction histidine kinase